MLKKTCLVLLLIIVLTISCLHFSVYAKDLTIEKGVITIDTVSAINGDTVIVPINITENPGFSSFSISVTYDSSKLEFIEHIRGNVIDCESRAHPHKNIIRVVGGIKGSGDKKNNGTIINLKFKVSDSASSGLSEIGISYKSGDFCNWDLDIIMPKIVSGGVKVLLTEKNCPHKNYTDWKTSVLTDCNDNRVEQRNCTDCGHIELRETSPSGHTFSKDYTVDKIATETEYGSLSIHCTNCEAVTNELSFSIQHSKNGKFKNVLGATVKNTEYLKQLLKEQYPDSSPTVSKPSQTDKPSPDSSQVTESSPSTSTPETDLAPPDTEVDNTADSKVTVTEKIEEVFPQSEQYVKFFKVLIVVIIIIMII